MIYALIQSIINDIAICLLGRGVTIERPYRGLKSFITIKSVIIVSA